MRGALIAALLWVGVTPVLAEMADPPPTRMSWTEEEITQILTYYDKISVLSRSSHWHDYDCCQTYRCFPAKPGSVKRTLSGNWAITYPDGQVVEHHDDETIWKPKRAEGLNDPRAHVCFEKVNGRWTVLCAYRAEIFT